MASLYDNPELSAARTAASSASSNASALSSQAQSLPDMLRQTLTKKFTTDNPLYGEREGALTDYMKATTQAPLDYTAKSGGGNSDVVYNPLQQANLIQGRIANPLARLSTANSKLALASGGIGDTVDSATRAYGGIVSAAQGDAASKRQAYDDLFKETSAKSDEDYKNKQLALDYAKLAQSGSKSTGLKLSDLLAIYSAKKPTAAQQTMATNGQSGLDAIATIRSQLAKNKNINALASSPLAFFDKNAQTYNSAKTEAVDVLTRLRTGAALNKDEQKTYDSLFSAFNKGEVTTQNLDRLEKLYTSAVKNGTKQDVMEFLNQYGGLSGGSDWEVVQ